MVRSSSVLIRARGVNPAEVIIEAICLAVRVPVTWSPGMSLIEVLYRKLPLSSFNVTVTSVYPPLLAAASALLRASELSTAPSGSMNALTAVSSGLVSSVASEESALTCDVSAEAPEVSAETGGVHAELGSEVFPFPLRYSISGLPIPYPTTRSAATITTISITVSTFLLVLFLR